MAVALRPEDLAARFGAAAALTPETPLREMGKALRELKKKTQPKVWNALAENEEQILAELNAAQGAPVDIGGYYNPDDALATAAMRPSPALNAIIDSLQAT